MLEICLSCVTLALPSSPQVAVSPLQLLARGLFSAGGSEFEPCFTEISGRGTLTLPRPRPLAGVPRVIPEFCVGDLPKSPRSFVRILSRLLVWVATTVSAARAGEDPASSEDNIPPALDAALKAVLAAGSELRRGGNAGISTVSVSAA